MVYLNQTAKKPTIFGSAKRTAPSLSYTVRSLSLRYLWQSLEIPVYSPALEHSPISRRLDWD